jgi:hypothetical protein
MATWSTEQQPQCPAQHSRGVAEVSGPAIDNVTVKNIKEYTMLTAHAIDKKIPNLKRGTVWQNNSGVMLATVVKAAPTMPPPTRPVALRALASLV